MRSKSKSSKRILNYSPLLILLIILSLSIVSAQAPVKSNEPYNFTITCSYQGQLTDSASSRISVQNPNGSYLFINQSGTNIGGGQYYYESTPSPLGLYNMIGECCQAGLCNSNSESLEVTETGNSFSQSQIGVVIAFALLTGIFIVIAFAFSKEKWKQRGAFFVLALLMGIITINSVRVLAQGSPVLSLMASVALWVTIVAASFMFLYLLVYYTRETIKYFKNKKDNRWNSENVI